MFTNYQQNKSKLYTTGYFVKTGNCFRYWRIDYVFMYFSIIYVFCVCINNK